MTRFDVNRHLFLVRIRTSYYLFFPHVGLRSFHKTQFHPGCAHSSLLELYLHWQTDPANAEVMYWSRSLILGLPRESQRERWTGQIIKEQIFNSLPTYKTFTNTPGCSRFQKFSFYGDAGTVCKQLHELTTLWAPGETTLLQGCCASCLRSACSKCESVYLASSCFM